MHLKGEALARFCSMHLFSTSSGRIIPLTGKASVDAAALEFEWGAGLRYRGMDVLDAYVNEVRPSTDRRWKDVYLGYVPQKDVFVGGYDGFGVVYFNIDDFGVVRIGEEVEEEGACSFYGDGMLKDLHGLHPDLLDLRLD